MTFSGVGISRQSTRLSIGLIVLVQLNYAIAPQIAFVRRL